MQAYKLTNGKTMILREVFRPRRPAPNRPVNVRRKNAGRAFNAQPGPCEVIAFRLGTVSDAERNNQLAGIIGVRNPGEVGLEAT